MTGRRNAIGMEIIYLLIPLSLILVGLIIWAFLWSIRSGQFDDLEGPAYRILMDDDDRPPAENGLEEDKGRPDENSRTD